MFRKRDGVKPAEPGGLPPPSTLLATVKNVWIPTNKPVPDVGVGKVTLTLVGPPLSDGKNVLSGSV